MDISFLPLKTLLLMYFSLQINTICESKLFNMIDFLFDFCLQLLKASLSKIILGLQNFRAGPATNISNS